MSCSRTQCSDSGEALTRGPSVSSQALFHWATALPAVTWDFQQSLRWYVRSERSLVRAFDSCLNIHMKCPSLKWGYTGSSESIHIKIPHCWKSRVAAHILMCPSLSGCEAGMNEWPSNRSTYVVCVRAWRDGTKFSQTSLVSQRCVLEKDTFILHPRKTPPNVTERLLTGT